MPSGPIYKKTQSDEDLENRFQEEHGAYLFQEGKPRALLEAKSPDISTEIYEARLKGYDREKTAKDGLRIR